MNLFAGIGIIITRGQSVTGFPEQFLEIGNGTILGVPIYLLVFLVMVVISYILLNKTKYGFDLKFYGSNPRASLFAGISNYKVALQTYMLSGIISAIVGLGFIARTNSAKADYGSAYIFASILCVILGGINPSGGYGKLSGVLLSLFSLQLLSSGFNMLRLPGSAKELAWGILLLTVMALNTIIEKRRLNKKSKVIIDGGAANG
jgi:simple sugar transport system permease protein